MHDWLYPFRISLSYIGIKLGPTNSLSKFKLSANLYEESSRSLSPCTEAVKKARQDANKNIVRIPIIDGRTIPHEVVGVKGATRVIIKPAKEGTGLIAGGAVRSVLEIAGYHDITSKSLGSRKKINVARATIGALQSLKTAEQVAESRGKSVEEILR